MYDEQNLIDDLRRLLKERRMSLRELSRAIDVPYRSIQNYLSGENRMPAIVLVRALEVLGSDTRYLRTGDNLLRHSDILDAIWLTIGDELLAIDTNKLGRNEIRSYIDNDKHTEKRRIAHLLAVKLSESYDECTKDHKYLRKSLPTIKELREKWQEQEAKRGGHSAIDNDNDAL